MKLKWIFGWHYIYLKYKDRNFWTVGRSFMNKCFLTIRSFELLYFFVPEVSEGSTRNKTACRIVCESQLIVSREVLDRIRHRDYRNAVCWPSIGPQASVFVEDMFKEEGRPVASSWNWASTHPGHQDFIVKVTLETCLSSRSSQKREILWICYCFSVAVSPKL